MNKIYGMEIVGCGVGVSVPEGSPGPDIHGLKAVDTGVVYQVRDRPNLLEQLGLPADTDPKILQEAFALILPQKGQPLPVIAESLRESKLIKLLGVGANVAGIAGLILQYC